jgi:hypothetical protein
MIQPYIVTWCCIQGCIPNDLVPLTCASPPTRRITRSCWIWPSRPRYGSDFGAASIAAKENEPGGSDAWARVRFEPAETPCGASWPGAHGRTLSWCRLRMLMIRWGLCVSVGASHGGGGAASACLRSPQAEGASAAGTDPDHCPISSIAASVEDQNHCPLSSIAVKVDEPIPVLCTRAVHPSRRRTKGNHLCLFLHCHSPLTIPVCSVSAGMPGEQAERPRLDQVAGVDGEGQPRQGLQSGQAGRGLQDQQDRRDRQGCVACSPYVDG